MTAQAILSKLVSIPSDGVNHPEHLIQEYVKSLLQPTIFENSLRVGKISRSRYNCLFYNDLSRAKVLFCCHVDTVEALAAHVFNLRREGDKLFGLGTKDMKGGLASLLATLLELGQKNLQHVALLCYVDEEHAQLGMQKFIENAPQMPLELIVSSESRYNLAAAHRGFCRLKLTVKGVSAHTARPHLGRNAISAAIEIYRTIENFFHEQVSETLGPSTPTLTYVHGGISSTDGKIKNSDNQVPNFAEALISVRTSKILNITELAALLAKSHPQDDYMLELLENLPPNELEKDELENIYQLFQRFDPEIELGNPRFAGYNDASELKQVYHCPTVNFGPYGENNHTADEWVSKTSLEKTQQVFIKLINYFATNL